MIVTKPGLATGLTITTTKRVYLIHLRSVAKSKVRVVRWTYPAEPVRTEAKVRMLPDPTRPQHYHVGYAVEASEPRPVWLPRQALDDGRKTYVLFPVNLSVMPAPMVRLVGPTGFELVNARLVGSVMVLDHLFSVAELRLGTGRPPRRCALYGSRPVPLPALAMPPVRCGLAARWRRDPARRHDAHAGQRFVGEADRPLRACLRRYHASQATDPQVDHGDADHGLAGVG